MPCSKSQPLTRHGLDRASFLYVGLMQESPLYRRGPLVKSSNAIKIFLEKRDLEEHERFLLPFRDKSKCRVCKEEQGKGVERTFIYAISEVLFSTHMTPLHPF